MLGCTGAWIHQTAEGFDCEDVKIAREILHNPCFAVRLCAITTFGSPEWPSLDQLACNVQPKRQNSAACSLPTHLDGGRIVLVQEGLISRDQELSHGEVPAFTIPVLSSR